MHVLILIFNIFRATVIIGLISYPIGLALYEIWKLRKEGWL